MLVRRGHDAWTAAQAGLNQAPDDTLTVYAYERDAVLLTHDREFSQRRRRNVVGRHLYLRCNEWDATGLLESHLDDLVAVLATTRDLYIAISMAGMVLERNWE